MSAPSAHITFASARARLTQFLDPETAVEIGADVTPEDPLRFRDSKRYRDRLAAAQKAVGERDAFVVMSGTLEGIDIVAGAFEFSFMGGSMGSVVGSASCGVEHAIAHRTPVCVLSASGGGAHAGRAASAADGEDEFGPRRACGGAAVHLGQTDPTTGGVSASLRCSAT
jgi:acetyl-CoA carboxylase carboxyl transferase subunit beta